MSCKMSRHGPSYVPSIKIYLFVNILPWGVCGVRGENMKSQRRAPVRPVPQRQSGAAFGDSVTNFSTIFRCKVPCSILHATLSFWNAHNKQNSVQISSLQEQ